MSNGTRRYDIAYRLGRALLVTPFAWYLRFRFKPVGKIPTPYLVVANHTMDLDFMLVMRAFPRLMHFVIGDTVFQSGLLRRLLVSLHNPVALRKGGTDMRAVLAILQRLRAGQNICLFAEGHTCFDGVTGPIPRGTATLARSAGATLVTYVVGGGYFTAPRWGRGFRRGRTWGEVKGIYPPEQLKAMTDAEIAAQLARDLHIDAAQEQQVNPVPYRGRRPAEGLENALYLCPRCLSFDSLQGEDNRLHCTACGTRAVYTPLGALEGDFGQLQIRDWVAWQRQTLAGMMAEEGFALKDEGQTLRQVQEDHKVREVAHGTLHMDRRHIRIGEWALPMDSLRGVAIFRKNRLLLTDSNGERYDFASDHVRSALKYKDMFELIKE